MLGFPAAIEAATYSKANNAANLNLTTSWTGGVVPTNTDVGQWGSTVTSANTVSLGANLEWLGVKVVNPGGPVTLNAGNTLTLDGSGVDLSAATQDLTANCDLALGASQAWTVASGRNFTLGGGVSGTALLTLPGSGTVTCNGGSCSFGTSAAGNNALALNGSGPDSKVMKDILSLVHDKGQGTGPKDEVGSVLYTRGLIIQMLSVEAVRRAQVVLVDAE